MHVFSPVTSGGTLRVNSDHGAGDLETSWTQPEAWRYARSDMLATLLSQVFQVHPIHTEPVPGHGVLYFTPIVEL